jgi:hypothetical protein
MKRALLLFGLLLAGCNESPLSPAPDHENSRLDPTMSVAVGSTRVTLDAAAEPVPYDLSEVGERSWPTFDDSELRALVAALSPTPGPGQVELVINGSFEVNGGPASPVFVGWENYNQPGGDQNGFRVQTGTLSPPPGVFPVPPPPDGLFAAMTTQLGPGTHIISQVITLPPNGNGQLFFRLFIGNRAGVFFSPPSLSFTVFPNQQFRMDVMDPAAPIDDVGAGVLLNVYQTRPGDPPVSDGYLTVTADLSAFNGRSVRLRFAEVDNQFFFNAGVDDVSVIAQIDPTDKEQCKNGGWENFGFKNQGQCVRFVETGKDSRKEE